MPASHFADKMIAPTLLCWDTCHLWSPRRARPRTTSSWLRRSRATTMPTRSSPRATRGASSASRRALPGMPPSSRTSARKSSPRLISSCGNTGATRPLSIGSCAFTTHKCYDYLRRRRRAAPHISVDALLESGHEPPAPQPSVHPDLERLQARARPVGRRAAAGPHPPRAGGPQRAGSRRGSPAGARPTSKSGLSAPAPHCANLWRKRHE